MAELDLGVHAVPADRQLECGDGHLVLPAAEATLFAVVDGLGHGAAARAAASAAIAAITEIGGGADLGSLFRGCHAAIQRTRGCVMTVARHDSAGSSISWAAVGNVSAGLFRRGGVSCARPLPRSGVVGVRLPEIRVTTVGVEIGDLLVIATDGVDPGWSRDPVLDDPGPARLIARVLVDRHGLAHDDRLVLVARLGGHG